MTYTPRTTQPSSSDPRFTKSGYGGYNNCILGSPLAWSGSVLANCTGYVHGRWMEIGNTNSEYNLSLGNANSYYGHSDSYERGSEPKLGAILCLGGGSAGHVAIVEEILDNGDIMCSESNYGRTVFEYVRRYKSTGYMRAGGTVGGFQGFIYHPAVSPAPTTYTVNCYNCRGSAEQVEEGTKITVTVAKVPKGYKFYGWTADGLDLQPGRYTEFYFIMPAHDITITAIFKPVSNKIILYGARQVYKGGIM